MRTLSPTTLLLTLALAAHSALLSAPCVTIRALDSPVSIFGAFASSILSAIDPQVPGRRVNFVQIMQNSQQTQFKFLLTELEGNRIKSYIGIRSEVVTVDGKDAHRIVKYVQSTEQSDVEVVISANYGAMSTIDCIAPKLGQPELRKIFECGKCEACPLTAKEEVSDEVRCRVQREQVEQLTAQLQTAKNMQAMQKDVASSFSEETKRAINVEVDALRKKHTQELTDLAAQCNKMTSALAKENDEKINKLRIESEAYSSTIQGKFQQYVDMFKQLQQQCAMGQSMDDLVEAQRENKQLKSSLAAINGRMTELEASVKESASTLGDLRQQVSTCTSSLYTKMLEVEDLKLVNASKTAPIAATKTAPVIPKEAPAISQPSQPPVANSTIQSPSVPTTSPVANNSSNNSGPVSAIGYNSLFSKLSPSSTDSVSTTNVFIDVSRQTSSTQGFNSMGNRVNSDGRTARQGTRDGSGGNYFGLY